MFVSAIPLRERDGGGEAAAVANYVVVFSEMPELAEDEHEVEAMMRGLAERLLLVDPAGMKVVNVSKEFGDAILGGVTKKVNGMVGKDYGQFVSEQTDEKLEVARLREGMRRRTQCTNVRLTGVDVLGGDVQLVHACPLKDGSGNTPLFVCLHCDITEEERQVGLLAEAAASSRDEGLAAMEAASRAGPLVSRAIVAGIWVAFFQEFQQSSCEQAQTAVARRSACRLRVRDILEDPTSRYTKDHLLILCQQYHYSAGMLLLLQQLDFHDTILDYYMLYNEYEKVISFANEFGADDNSLWTKVVQFLAGNPHEHFRDLGCFVHEHAFLEMMII